MIDIGNESRGVAGEDKEEEEEEEMRIWWSAVRLGMATSCRLFSLVVSLIMRFSSVWILGAAAGVAASQDYSDEYDYVIVGAGVCGLVVANRLSRHGKTVAVIETGTDQRTNQLVRNPLSYWENLRTDINYNYTSEPEDDAQGRVVTIYAGKGIGGSSLVNGMVYIRGDKAQFDAWERLGNPGWNWEALLPYYKQVEKLQLPEPWQVQRGAIMDAQNHGFSGELHVGFSPKLYDASAYADLRSAWGSLGLGANGDPNRGDTRGSFLFPHTIDAKQNLRWDAATAFLWPVVNQRRNLRVLRGTARRVLWKSGGEEEVQAEGVEYVTADGAKVTIRARREVILSAGALRTPLILERSGIGNTRLLAKEGIKTVVHLPGVGENLMDQAASSITFESKRRLDDPESPTGWGSHQTDGRTSSHAAFVTVRDLFGDEFEKIKEETKRSLSTYALKAARDASHGGTEEEIQAWASSVERVLEVQFDLLFSKETTAAELMTFELGNILGSAFWGLIPFSRGSVHIGGPDADRPVLRPRFTSAEIDKAILVAAGKLAGRIWAHPSLSKLVATQYNPRVEDLPLGRASEEQWRSWAARTLGSGLHPLGTAAMMERGLGGLWMRGFACLGRGG
ncbi:GMC oxidoreductase [Ophiocordyceps camponoti-floridani]|uniref:GMC oxidoreductase n=1 Tax=Ophiocordyceps camponoti-floridani TaxID=2030778 RepID=A0A8H4Q7G3_9HYPO|nr:GMC oxidoreductase [Ophiocordyceps camponoti-floridani]